MKSYLLSVSLDLRGERQANAFKRVFFDGLLYLSGIYTLISQRNPHEFIVGTRLLIFLPFRNVITLRQIRDNYICVVKLSYR